MYNRNNSVTGVTRILLARFVEGRKLRSAAEALWRDEGCALRNALRENIRDCYGHAEHCRRRAKEQSDPLLRQDFLDCERRWLLLARGYELAERMDALSKGLPPAKRVKVAA